jgi:hypothetical protein
MDLAGFSVRTKFEIRQGVYAMKKFILSILCVLPALLFATGTNATVFKTTLEFHGLGGYSNEHGLIAGAKWWLEPDLPIGESASWTVD